MQVMPEPCSKHSVAPAASQLFALRDNQPSPLQYYAVIIFMTHACAVSCAYKCYASTISVISTLLTRGYARYHVQALSLLHIA